ncbi:MAG: Na+/H+ antiporter subunit C [Desulfobacteraceae bacterium]|nr:Na+/H+ antiporter subunit C [Desulfobacteraceae bacterium]
METALAFMCGIIAAASIYLMLSGNLIRFIFGLVLATNAVNLLIFVSGRLAETRPPLIGDDAAVPVQEVANALPQALILTAIVIGFALLTFVFILFYRTYQSLGTVDTESMRISEPAESDPDDGATPGDKSDASGRVSGEGPA